MRPIGLVVSSCLVVGCSADPPAVAQDPQADVVKQYVALMRANSGDVVRKLEALDAAAGELTRALRK
jgi:hypothetical protein